jgi:diguanylate cyclase (GGDEF)-like protein/PAS domain S-box-containing protein
MLAQKVFDNSPDAIMITDLNNRIVSVNEAFVLITGYAPGEVTGEDPRMLSSGVHDKAFYQQMWESLQRRGHWAGEIIDRRKSGDIYPKWMTINAVTDPHSGKLTHYVSMFSDITERKNSEERIHYLAHHDTLTALPNRFSLETRLEQACLEARRRNGKLAVLFIDLDRFKVINDTLGHQIGDRLLIEVAKRLTTAVRESDTVARLGGDEFVIVLPDVNTPNDAAGVAAKIIEALAKPVIVGEQQLHTSPSIGISIYPIDGADADTIMRNADTAMYHAKALGRNNFQFYSAEMNRAASERLDIESRLRHALSRKEFELHYQPQLSADGTKVVGVEALLRWNPADGRGVPPTRFIPIAEETGMILEIGEWVLRTACQQLKTWLDAGVPPLRLAVNVSARQLRKQNFPDIVASALSESGLPAHLLELEITESAVMEEPEEARLILERLKKMGATLAIDDFGTGYSSLAYLKLFPIDSLKIDRSFVTDIGRHADDAAIAISTIALAHSLGINVIAEGVETDAQHDLLREHRCNEFQGYLFSRPLAEADALAFLRQAAIEPI